ncbi:MULTISPECIES: NTP transferase domain-containing protein [Halorussus]|uniref:NTP transferase domain-containing protein n=1 Tax=Halorussus TaxID=1070314 RepID=UPI000E20DF76|nr:MULTISPECIES: NTP transferase domain-containing protein [Halorussus]NHN57629.1 NTP transferase domain-containing protein [Halorussus sp. JP-T4]
MCGGRGTRLDAEREKPLFEVAGRPMLARVADALAESEVGTVYAVVSPNAPETRKFATEHDSLSTIESPGDGYVTDLQTALDAVETPVLTVAADLPLLDADAVNAVLDAYATRRDSDPVPSGPPSLTVCVPAALKRALGASADTIFEPSDGDGRELAPAGVNVVAETDTETMYETYDARLAVNVNRLSDADLAEGLL